MCTVDRDFLEPPAPVAYRTLYHNPGNHRPGDRVQQRKELLQLVQPGIGDVDDVFVFYRKALGEKIGIGVAEIETVDDRGAATGPGCQSGSFQSADDRGWLEPKQKDSRRIRALVLQPPGLGQRLSQRYLLGAKGHLHVLSRCAEYREGLRDVNQGQQVPGPRIDVLGRFRYQLLHRNRRGDAVARKPYEGLIDRGFRPTREGDQIEET